MFIILLCHKYISDTFITNLPASQSSEIRLSENNHEGRFICISSDSTRTKGVDKGSSHTFSKSSE